MKKTEVISLRVYPETMQQLKQLADEKEWSVAHVVYWIVSNYLKSKSDQEARV